MHERLDELAEHGQFGFQTCDSLCLVRTQKTCFLLHFPVMPKQTAVFRVITERVCPATRFSGRVGRRTHLGLMDDSGNQY